MNVRTLLEFLQACDPEMPVCIPSLEADYQEAAEFHKVWIDWANRDEVEEGDADERFCVVIE